MILTTDMVNTIITLILGLIFQITQAVPGAVVATPMPQLAESCGCCTGLDSCPCAENGEPSKRPAPLAPEAGGGLKIPVAKADEPRISSGWRRNSGAPTQSVSCLLSGLPCGYAGVSLAVAFCSFVI